MYISFSLNSKLIFFDSFQLLNFSLDNLFKNLGENDFKHLSQVLDSEVLDLFRQKGFYPH